jgi:hypothetical protein
MAPEDGIREETLYYHKKNASNTKGLFPLERFTATESSAVVISTGNGHRGRLALLNEQRQCPLPVKTARFSAFRAAKRSSGNGPLVLSILPGGLDSFDP